MSTMNSNVPLTRAILIGRTGGLVDFVIDHPAVSLRHAKVFRRGASAFVLDLGSSTGTYVDGCRAHSEVELRSGATISIGPIRLHYDGHCLHKSDDTARCTSLCCVNVSKSIVQSGRGGQKLTLLHNVSLAISPGELVCLIGPSGAGKSTLLSVLSGRCTPDSGRILMSGRNLVQEYDSLKLGIAFVPQTEVLFPPLTARQALFYSAALRLPTDTTEAELNQLVSRVLQDVGLEHHADVRIRDLSGGQRKRVGLASEITHRPGIVFLDEVTSGLDELVDYEIMTLVRRLTNRGLSAICITHNTLNIERTANRVAVLAPEGRLACFGTPREVCHYFGVPRLGDVYGVLAQRPAPHWQERFRTSRLYRKNIHQWLPAARLSSSTSCAAASSPTTANASHSTDYCWIFFRKIALLIFRMTAIQKMDPRPLATAITQAFFVALLLVAFFGDLTNVDDPLTRIATSRNAAFLLVVSAFWLGCNNAAPEIVRERRIFQQERAIGVDVLPYAISKVLVLGVVSITQALIVLISLSTFSHLPGDGGWPGALRRAFIIASTALLGTVTGLAVSAISRSESVAVRIVPMLVIPQIVLSDVLSPLVGWLCWFGPIVASSYWTFLAFTSGTAAYQTAASSDGSGHLAVAAIAGHTAVVTLTLLYGLRRPHS